MVEYQVRVDGGEPFAVAEGAKLALAIENHGIDISHRCGGQAKCTTCRVAVHGDSPPMGKLEEECLIEDGVLGQFRLSCQIRVHQDLDVQVLMHAKDQGWDPGVALEP